MPYYGQRKEIKEEFKSRWGKGVIVLKKNLKKKKKPILVRINIMKKYFTLQFFNIDAVLAKADNRSTCSSGGGNTSAHMQQTSSGRPWMLHKHMRPYLRSPATLIQTCQEVYREALGGPGPLPTNVAISHQRLQTPLQHLKLPLLHRLASIPPLIPFFFPPAGSFAG